MTVWWSVSAEFCDPKHSPSQNSIALLTKFCAGKNGTVSHRQCDNNKQTKGYEYKCTH